MGELLHSLKGLWLPGAVGLLVAALGWVLLVGGRTGGLEGEVHAILKEARRQQDQLSSRGAIARWPEFLLRLLLIADGWSSPGNYRSPWELSEELVKLGTNSVPILLRSMESDRSDAVREVCVRALGGLSARSAAPALARMLTADKARNVRVEAAQALGELGDAAVLPVVRRSLYAETDEGVRAEDVVVLFKLGGPTVAAELLALGRRETNWAVRARIAGALSAAREPRALPLFGTWLGERPATHGRTRFPAGYNPHEHLPISEVIRAAGDLGGGEAFELLADRWKVEPEESVRRTICEVFGAMADPRVLPMLREALNEKDEIRAAAVTAMGQVGDTSVIGTLKSLLGDPGKNVRRNAAVALGRLADSAGVPALLEMLKEDATGETRSDVARVLGEIGDPAAFAPLLKSLEQMSKGRESLLWALGHFGSTNAIPALAAALKSTEREESFAAAYALAEIGGADSATALAANLADKDRFSRYGKACALALLGRADGLDTVKAGLQAKEAWQRFGAIIALARLGFPANAPEWEPALNDADPSLRLLAAGAAGGRVVPALTAMLGDRSDDYRQYAARAQMFFKDPTALPALREACKDRNPSVREAAQLAVRFIERSAGKRP